MTAVELDDRQLTYLLGKIRQDIRTRRRYLSRPDPRPDLTENEVRAMLSRRRSELGFREDLYERLGGDPGDLASTPGAEARHGS